MFGNTTDRRDFNLRIPILFLVVIFLVVGVFETKLYGQFNRITKTVLEEDLSNYALREEVVLYVEIGLETYLLEFLENNIVDEEDDLEFHDFRAWMSEQEQRKLFNREEINHFKEQLSSISDEFMLLLELPDNMRQSCDIVSEVKKNFEIGVPLDAGISKFVISKPLLTRDKNFVIFATAVGARNSMSGGVAVYKNSIDGYQRYTMLGAWIE